MMDSCRESTCGSTTTPRYQAKSWPKPRSKRQESLAKRALRSPGPTATPRRRILATRPGAISSLDQPTLSVRILPHFGAVPGTDKRTMGFALGNLASVSLRRVSEEAAEFGVQPYEVLGPAIAHELGHLLLGQQGHSPSGIMRARWRREDYERAPLGAFKFTAEQARSVRAEVGRRVQKQGAAEVTTATASK